MRYCIRVLFGEEAEEINYEILKEYSKKMETKQSITPETDRKCYMAIHFLELGFETEHPRTGKREVHMHDYGELMLMAEMALISLKEHIINDEYRKRSEMIAILLSKGYSVCEVNECEYELDGEYH